MCEDSVHEEETSELEVSEGSNDMIWRRMKDVPGTGLESTLEAFSTVVKDIMTKEVERVGGRLL